MKHQLGKIRVRDTAEALQAAEVQLERPPWRPDAVSGFRGSA
jgi:hypothetical protein